MDSYQKIILFTFFFLLTGAEVPSVIHPFKRTCAVRGSTVTLPCTFTPLKSFIRKEDGKEISLRIVRVGWCVKHEICQELQPHPVYDSNSTKNDLRYQYLGDMKGNCTLQISNIQMKDNETFRFRMEADNPAGHFTNRAGVSIRVVDGVKMSIKSSRDDKQFKRGETVSLQCTSSACTTHQLNIAWFRDGHALSETGSILQLGPLAAEDSGNYSCALGTNKQTLSEPYSLQVEAAEKDKDGNLSLILGVVFGVLLAFITLILVVFIIKRKRAADLRSEDAEMRQKHTDNVYGNVVPPVMEGGGYDEQETSPETEDISYAPIQFKNTTTHRHVEETGEAVIYSSVATRG
ncbi:uncharacterized protein LOC121641039 [Melanotaenia boesemani]|uniref:uncharacterized protein LOC121641039 n=1 Tax=Melanotaenia boesemani TaxID=1250792 RepID=UPI001C04A001|nr:uncharacterized protein LOC121641039 [Melanotaenia boesemani]